MVWKPGQSGNPKGRAKNTPMFAWELRKILDGQEVLLTITSNVNGKKKVQTLDLKVDKNVKAALGAVMVKEALAGNLTAMKEIIDRVDGKALQQIDLTETHIDEIDTMTTEELQARAKDIISRLGGVLGQTG